MLFIFSHHHYHLPRHDDDLWKLKMKVMRMLTFLFVFSFHLLLQKKIDLCQKLKRLVKRNIQFCQQNRSIAINHHLFLKTNSWARAMLCF